MPVKLLVCDDHDLIIHGVKSIISTMDGYEVVGETTSGCELAVMAAELKPDICLVDITMPDADGIEIVKAIKAKDSSIICVIMSMHIDKYHVIEALKAGASGYFIKNTIVEEIPAGIAIIMSGKRYISNQISTDIIEDLLFPSVENDATPLTSREIEIVSRIADGESTKEIAFNLNLSIKTINTHRENIMKKLDIHSIAELTKYAVKTGLSSL
jgi:DNA-binding NarL/FixJ family response regulator